MPVLLQNLPVSPLKNVTRPTLPILLILCAALFSGSVTVVQAKPEKNGATGSLYEFDQVKNGRIRDRSGNNNHGIVHGGLTESGGATRPAMRFNGKDTYVLVPFSESLALPEKDAADEMNEGPNKDGRTMEDNRTGLVLEARFRPGTVSGQRTLISRYEEKNKKRSFRLGIEDGRMVFNVSWSGNRGGLWRGSLAGGLRSETTLEADRWHEVKLIYDGAVARFIINGERDPARVYIPGIHPARTPIQIGRHYDGETGSAYFRGDIERVRIAMPSFALPDWTDETRNRTDHPGHRNNLVTDLLTKTDPAADKYTVTNPEDGWIFVKLHGVSSNETGATIHSDGWEGRIELNPENRFEAMRRVSEGKHNLRLRLHGEMEPSELIVRAVPELFYSSWEYGRHVGIDRTLRKRAVMPHVNVIESYHHKPLSIIRDWIGSGRNWLVLRSENRGRQPWRLGLPGKRLYSGACVDEFGPYMWHDDHSHFHDHAKALDQLYGEDPSFRFFAYFFGLELFPSNHEFVDTIIDHDGRIVWERYLSEPPTRDAAKRTIENEVLKPMRRVRAIRPGVESHILWCPSTFSGARKLTDDVYPDVDYRVWLDMQYRTVATDPVFRGVGGFANWTSGYADRELARWLGALYRHYGIKGNTSSLSEELGYQFKLNHLKSPGFDDGIEDMRLKTAGRNSAHLLPVEELPNSVREISADNRVGPRGSQVLQMTSEENSSNRMIVPVHNLDPGRCYSIKLYTLNLENPRRKPGASHKVSLKVEDGVRVEQETNSRITEGIRNGSDNVYFGHHRLVFRAGSEDTRLEISDADVPAGRTLMYDFLQVQPYYMGERTR